MRAATPPADTLRGQAAPQDRARFPTALTSFPYVDYHPAFPYSVFLGPGGARYNLPQLYWHTIGVTVGGATSTPSASTGVYERGIYPLGQTYENPPISPDPALPADGALVWARRRQLVVVAGDPKARVAALGRDVEAIPGAGRSGSGYPVLQGQPRRPRGLGAGAPERAPAGRFP